MSASLESSFTRDAAQALTQELRADYVSLQEKIAAAWRGHIWLALNYDSWQEYLDSEFSGVSLRPPKELEEQVLQELDEAGMSTRGIASAIDMPQRTVSDRLTTGERFRSPETKIGLDGKSYPARRPEPPASTEERDVVDAEIVEESELSGQVSIGDELSDDRWASSNGDRLASEMGIETVDLSGASAQQETRGWMRKQYTDLVGQAGGGIPAVNGVVGNIAMALQVHGPGHKLSEEELSDIAESSAEAARQLAALLVEITKATVHPGAEALPTPIAGGVVRDAQDAAAKLHEIEDVLTEAGFRF